MTTPYSTTSVVHHLKEAYLIWLRIVPHMPKGARYTIGARIENTFLDLLEKTYASYFTEKEAKYKKVTGCVILLNSLKFLLSIAWEAKLLSHKQYEEIAFKLNDVGKMLGGWRKNIELSQNKNRTKE